MVDSMGEKSTSRSHQNKMTALLEALGISLVLNGRSTVRECQREGQIEGSVKVNVKS